MKTEATLALEREIWKYTHKQGTYGCFEVTIGWFGKERVDYITYDTKGDFRCYEIKVSKSDFRSKAATTFIGHFNYYVMPPELYGDVSGEIPAGIGVYVGGRGLIKRPRRRELKVDIGVLKDSMIRSLCREYAKQIKSGLPTLVEHYEREMAGIRRMESYHRKEYHYLHDNVLRRFGKNWEDAPEIFSESGRLRD